MFGKYGPEGIQQITAQRSRLVHDLIAKAGGRVRESYALLGQYDLVFVVDLPNMTDAIRASMAMSRLTNISFSTCAAMPIAEFDQTAEDLETEIESLRMEAGE